MGRDEDVGEKLTAPPDFDGPTSRRRFTDVLCTLLLIAMWVSMTGLGIYGMQNGDYRKMLYPLDYEGNICGTDVGSIDMTDYPYLYYVNDYSGGVCVKECPRLKNLTDPYTLVTYDGLFSVEGSFVTEEDIAVADYSGSNNTLDCTETLCYPNGDPQSSYSSYGVMKGNGFAYYALDTYEVLRRCVFRDEAADKLNAIVNPNGNNFTEDVISMATQNEKVKKGYDIWHNLFSDLWTSRFFILGLGFGAPLVVGFCYTFMLRIPGVLPIMVWISIFATIGIVFAGAWYAGDTATKWKAADPPAYTDDEIKVATYSSYALYAVGGLLVLLFLFMRKRIQLAMGCVKEASKAILKMPLIILFPVLQGLGFMVFMIAWTVYSVNIASMGEFSTKVFAAGNIQITVRTFEFSDFVKKCGWYMLFCFFWSGQFILALGEIVFAMAVAKWYFARDKSQIGNLTVISSITTSMCYHTGTAAFGALLIAIIKMIRSFIAYLQKKADEMNSSIAKAILCCCQCCFYCLEKCMRFINKNAYIQTAIFGTNFCTSAKEAFFLILRNAARVGAITYVSGGVVFVGKVFICTLTTGLSYFALDHYVRDELYSVIGPLFFVAFISWFIAGMFMSVYDMGIATILQCFVADEEMFSSQQMYAEGSLKAWVDSHG
mmetsp:Transcript_37605/g.80219  ORF Transcript_37605/g.80219 Transcript_37605/m.80219 type:complete len:658 (-) Transcript_37605:105-2078(-)|eukprot:CAMPEP_0172542298 /NCGR_PEP_ID=MMETSP1067-20121228/12942_1 /TAXON_ID=265564 ORGANISM="Thalassiosira punctigera, Strain Tpunct2005C2" /NCGR_SAMPLE_ID=MMETSP1067 /ASSEMBLY_ACC=CAM_ASM_000444 /LENGTH=657 /DNA_ID=CAMNT_0013328513 /DNA_START=229 /DNA_END=2202 /DNA_ORIENTATION=+